MIRQKNRLNCPHCGKPFPVDPENLPAFCPLCGQALGMDEEMLKDLLGIKPPKPGQEPIPELSTEGAEPKTPGQYVLEALRWAVIVAAFIGIMSFLFSQAASLMH